MTRNGRRTGSAPPTWIAPMLATLVEPRALPEGWIYEPKLDGLRAMAFVAGGRVRLLSRQRKALDSAFPELDPPLARAVRGTAVLDGEIVARGPDTPYGSFARLQHRMHRHAASRAIQREFPVELWLFDCLYYEGRDLTSEPWSTRREVLERAVRPRGPVRLTPVLQGTFAELFDEACAAGAEGLIGKRAAARYRGSRSRDWLKLKCVREQEFVVGGWTDPRGSRSGFGALLVGYYEGGRLHYAGKVGTGFDDATLGELASVLRGLGRRRSPFEAGDPPKGDEVHWVRPSLVAQIGFSEWTRDGRLRHPRFIGLRTDVDPAAVGREHPAAAP